MRRRQKGQKKRRRPSITIDEGRLVNLSPRQRQIALLVGAGGRNKEVAAKLNISEKTVKAHLTVIFIKLGLYDRVGLARFYKYFMSGPQTASP